jgi:hypothetical protein
MGSRMSSIEIHQVPIGALRARPKVSRARSKRGAIDIGRIQNRNPQNSQNPGLRFYAPPPPPKPIVAGASLTGDPINFVEFLFDDTCRNVCRVLFGTGTSAEQMLGEFRKATKSYYYGHRRGRPGRMVRNPGMLDAGKAARKKSLRQFVHLAYRGDPDRRGVQYWARIAALLWETHQQLMALRKRAESAKQKEIERIERLPALRARRAEYMRGYRKRRRRWSGN